MLQQAKDILATSRELAKSNKAPDPDHQKAVKDLFNAKAS